MDVDKRSLLPWTLAGACAAALLIWGPGPQGLLTESALPLLRAWDALNLALDPHLELTRAPERIDTRPLSRQTEEMERDLDARFTTAQGRLLLIDTPPVQVGDACLWQGVFAAEAALRYAREPDARRLLRARRALEGLALLASKGRPLARAVYPAGLPTESPGSRHYRDPRWQWKEDASVDSLAGWVFGVVMVRELAPPLRVEADRLLVSSAKALKASQYRLRNSDGSLTRYNAVGGALLNAPAGTLATLALLKAAQRADPAGPWGAEHARFARRRQDRWAAYASGPLLWRNKTTNHNIAFLGLCAALLGEDDARRRDLYARSLARLNRITEKMGNSFWIYLSLWTLERRGLPEAARDWTQRRSEHLARARVAMLEWDYPNCKLKREVKNSERGDLRTRPWPLSGRSALRQPLPVWQRPPVDFLWQRSAYALDDWAEYAGPPQRFSPLDFLIAYRLGLSIKALDGSE